MFIHCKFPSILLAFIFSLAALPSVAQTDSTVAARGKIEAALANVIDLDRPGEDGFATFWDGNKYVQCRRMPDRVLRCEAAGAAMQPSLSRVLTPARVARLSELDWQPDPAFGNFARAFAPTNSADIAARVLQALVEGYGADPAQIEAKTDFIPSTPCPPRAGPSQNLAGSVNVAPSMAATAVRGCAWSKPPENAPRAETGSPAELIAIHGKRVAAEIQRLRINMERSVFVIFDPGLGYVQCGPDAATKSIYCEAQSAFSWEALESVLTPERVARLYAAGYSDPGRGPNYWKLVGPATGTEALAAEILTLLHDVYGYAGKTKLKIKRETGEAK